MLRGAVKSILKIFHIIPSRCCLHRLRMLWVIVHEVVVTFSRLQLRAEVYTESGRLMIGELLTALKQNLVRARCRVSLSQT